MVYLTIWTCLSPSSSGTIYLVYSMATIKVGKNLSDIRPSAMGLDHLENVSFRRGSCNSCRTLVNPYKSELFQTENVPFAWFSFLFPCSHHQRLVWNIYLDLPDSTVKLNKPSFFMKKHQDSGILL